MMNKNIVPIAVIITICVFFSEARLKLNQCKKKAGSTIQSLEISGCTEYPCIMKKESNAQISLRFKLKKRIIGLKLKISGIIHNKEIPFSVDDSNHCEETISDVPNNCFLQKGETYNYSFSLPILAEYPSLALVSKFELTDMKGNSIVCFTFPTKIED